MEININIIIKESIIVLVTIVVTWFVTIKVKFAKDEKTAMRQAKRFLLTVGFLFLYGFIAYSLYSQFTAPEPLDRKALLSILILFSGIIVGLFLLLVSTIKSQVNVMDRHFNLTEDHIKNTRIHTYKN